MIFEKFLDRLFGFDKLATAAECFAWAIAESFKRDKATKDDLKKLEKALDNLLAEITQGGRRITRKGELPHDHIDEIVK